MLNRLIIFVFRYLIHSDLLLFDIDFETTAYSEIILLIRSLNFMLITIVIVFSIRHITSKFQFNIDLLGKQKIDLLETTIQMRKEIESRKKSELIARESEAKFENIFETSSDPMAIVNSTGHFLDFNLSFIRISVPSGTSISII